MKRFTVVFLLFAYLTGSMLTLVEAGEDATYEVITKSDMQQIEENTSNNEGFVNMIKDAFSQFVNALKVVFRMLTLSFKPLQYDTGIGFVDAVFKSFWAVGLTISYIDISQDIISVLHKLLVGIGSLIPFT